MADMDKVYAYIDAATEEQEAYDRYLYAGSVAESLYNSLGPNEQDRVHQLVDASKDKQKHLRRLA